MAGLRGGSEDITEAYYRGLMHSVGYRRSDLKKPQIAVVNSWTEVNPGHLPLRDLGNRLKEGIWAVQEVHRGNSTCLKIASSCWFRRGNWSKKNRGLSTDRTTRLPDFCLPIAEWSEARSPAHCGFSVDALKLFKRREMNEICDRSRGDRGLASS